MPEPFPSLPAALHSRVRRSGAEPLITYYDLDAGDRTELSARSFANWVDKTTNLLLAEGLTPADTVLLSVADVAPGHWMTAVWWAAVWQAGAVVAVGSDDPPALEVIGPPTGSPASWPADPGWPIWCCSLHPLGRGLAVEPPPHVRDYALDVRAQPDAHVAVPTATAAPAVATPECVLTVAEVAEAGGGSPARALVRPAEIADPWKVIRQTLVVPVVSGGSAVVVLGGDPAAVRRAAVAERVTTP